MSHSYGWLVITRQDYNANPTISPDTVIMIQFVDIMTFVAWCPSILQNKGGHQLSLINHDNLCHLYKGLLHTQRVSQQKRFSG